MKTLKATTIILLAVCAPSLIATKTRAQHKSNLEVLEVKPEPIRSGRNIFNAKISNTSSEDQAVSIDIRTETPTGNWQTQFPHDIPAGTTQWIHQAYKINGFVTEGLGIRIRFYANGPANSTNSAQTTDLFRTVQYSVGDLDCCAPDESELEPATESQRTTIIRLLRRFQKCVESNDYKSAWGLFSRDFQDTEVHGKLGTFEKAMVETPYWIFPLSRVEVLALEPKTAARREDALCLTTALGDERWMVSFVKVADNWRIDSIDRIDAAPKDEIPHDPESQKLAVQESFKQWQDALKGGQYETAWQLMADGLRRSSQLENDSKRFKNQWSSSENPMVTLFLNLRPESVTILKTGESGVLKARYSDQPWMIFFVVEDGRWKIRHVSRGHDNGGDWQSRLLPKMLRHTTEHFDIYCFKDSTAEKDIKKIAQQRDRGFREICRFLGKDSEVRIRMILFEDGATKYSHTGHQGAGWATGNTVVEIYNDTQSLDPYHETTHILMRPYGAPPALFNEGFATYMSERLGSHALASMKGGGSSIYERVRQLSGKGELIPLEKLLTYTQIGSRETNPPVAYPEAGSFVKFLIETYGKDKFLEAYGTLRNSGDESAGRQNVEALEGIYGKPLDELKNQWKRAFQGLE